MARNSVQPNVVTAVPDESPDNVPGEMIEDLAHRLRQAGQRVTSQRLVILAALRPDEHVSADEVLTRVEQHLPAVNRSTVYRTLELFRDLGLVSETDLGGGVRQFELIEETRHHHLICHGCGAVTEFDDALVAPLRQALRDQHQFVATADHLAVFGWCADCAANRDRSNPDPTPPEGTEEEDPP